MSRLVPLGCWLPVALLSSLVAALVLLDASQAQTAKGKKHALLVGVRQYAHDSLPDLKHTENDVEEVARVLARSGYRVRLLTSTRGKKAANARPTAGGRVGIRLSGRGSFFLSGAPLRQRPVLRAGKLRRQIPRRRRRQGRVSGTYMQSRQLQVEHADFDQAAHREGGERRTDLIGNLRA
jgi:hypothetical protein